MTPTEISQQAAALREFATPREAAYLEAIELTGTIGKAARSLGVTRGSVQVCLRHLAKRAALRGWSPTHDMTHTVPEPFRLKGTSTYYDRDGKPRGQWVKSEIDRDRLLLHVQETVEALRETMPRLDPRPAPRHTFEALCNQYTLTDAHIGMLAWHQEGGADWDLRIAEQTLVGAFEAMVAAAPAAGTAIVAQLGDWLHFDSLLPVTPQSGHVVDADNRYAKVVRVANRILRRIIDLALEKHSRVIVVLAEGNHDLSASVWMRDTYAMLYEREPRVEFASSPLPYYALQHGKTMLGYHHGHLRGPKMGLGLLMAAQFPAIWGATTKRYVHTGHLHSVSEQDEPGVRLIQHPTLAARDAYAARGGWLSERQAAAITYHAEFGEVARTIITPEMLV